VKCPSNNYVPKNVHNLAGKYSGNKQYIYATIIPVCFLYTIPLQKEYTPDLQLKIKINNPGIPGGIPPGGKGISFFLFSGEYVYQNAAEISTVYVSESDT